MLFIGPTALSGIGQQLRKYMKLFPDCKCIEINDEIPVCENAFIYALPIQYWLDKIPEIKRKIKSFRETTAAELFPTNTMARRAEIHKLIWTNIRRRNAQLVPGGGGRRRAPQPRLLQGGDRGLF